jgi:hypothetical protein
LGEVWNFDFFNLTKRNYFYINKSLSFLSIYGMPAVEPASQISNVITVIPPTRSSLKASFNRNFIRQNLENTKKVIEEDRAKLTLQNKSMIHFISPYASTSERTIGPGTAGQLLNMLGLPISLDINGEASDWYIAKLQSITRGAVLTEIMAELDEAAAARQQRKSAAVGRLALNS